MSIVAVSAVPVFIHLFFAFLLSSSPSLYLRSFSRNFNPFRLTTSHRFEAERFVEAVLFSVVVVSRSRRTERREEKMQPHLGKRETERETPGERKESKKNNSTSPACLQKRASKPLSQPSDPTASRNGPPSGYIFSSFGVFCSAQITFARKCTDPAPLSNSGEKNQLHTVQTITAGAPSSCQKRGQ